MNRKVIHTAKRKNWRFDVYDEYGNHFASFRGLAALASFLEWAQSEGEVDRLTVVPFVGLGGARRVN